jgi:plasmid stability protein
VPKTVQIRDLDDNVYAILQRRAAEEGISVPELLRQQAIRLASRPSMREWFDRASSHGRLDMSNEDISLVLDELRGPWADGDR